MLHVLVDLDAIFPAEDQGIAMVSSELDPLQFDPLSADAPEKCAERIQKT